MGQAVLGVLTKLNRLDEVGEVHPAIGHLKLLVAEKVDVNVFK